MPPFGVTVDDGAPGPATLQVEGELDIETAPVLIGVVRRTLSTRGVTAIHLDLSTVVFIDSTGIRALTLIDDACEDSQAELQLTAVSPYVARVLALVGLNDHFMVEAPADNGRTSPVAS